VALRALAEAERGNVESAMEMAESYSGLTRSRGVGYHISRFAVLVGASRGGGPSIDLESRAHEVISEVLRTEFMEALIVAYRSYPPVLSLIRGAKELRRGVAEVMERAGDGALARRLGLPTVFPSEPRDQRRLTPRERDVIELLCAGLSNTEIAQRLFISSSTAKVHVHHILRKLGAKTRAQAVVRWNELSDA
jgi:DNA-binding CsgD family transcriptional regulator